MTFYTDEFTTAAPIYLEGNNITWEYESVNESLTGQQTFFLLNVDGSVLPISSPTYSGKTIRKWYYLKDYYELGYFAVGLTSGSIDFLISRGNRGSHKNDSYGFIYFYADKSGYQATLNYCLRVSNCSGFNTTTGTLAPYKQGFIELTTDTITQTINLGENRTIFIGDSTGLKGGAAEINLTNGQSINLKPYVEQGKFIVGSRKNAYFEGSFIAYQQTTSYSDSDITNFDTYWYSGYLVNENSRLYVNDNVVYLTNAIDLSSHGHETIYGYYDITETNFKYYHINSIGKIYYPSWIAKSEYTVDNEESDNFIITDNQIKCRTSYKCVGKKNDIAVGSFYDADGSLTSPTIESNGYPLNNKLYYLEKTEETLVQGDPVKGDFIEYVFADSANAYPEEGVQDDYWYSYIGEVEGQGEFIEQIENSQKIYPEDGIQNGYYYKLYQTDTFYNKGELNGSVRSENEFAYPEDDRIGETWYEYSLSAELPENGYFIDEVSSSNESAFPANDQQDGYYYISLGSKKVYEKTLTDKEILGGVEYQIDISQNTDFSIGSTPSAEISLTINQTEEDSQWYLNQPCIYSVKFTDNDDWKQIGIFNITSIQKKDKISCRLTGYDNMIKLDRYVDSYINKLNYPLSLGTITTGLIQYCNLEYEDLDLCNSNYRMKQNFDITNITGREVLGYLAESNGCFAYCLPNGKITLKKIGYNSAIQDLDNSKYSKFSNDLYQVNPIDRVIVKQSEDDIGTYYPTTGTNFNPYIIAGNPVLLADTQNEIADQVKNIYLYIKNISYYPAELELFEDFDIQIGQYVNVNSKKILVLSKKITNKGVSISSTGNQRRQTADSINSQLSMLRGKSNQLVRDIEKTQSTLTDNTNKLQSQITQTASSLQSTITDNYNSLQSQITQTASGLETTIEDKIKGVNSTITQTAESINSTIQSQDGRINSIEQTLDGVVYDNGSGTTIINGDNITTGTISADRINMTGSISWGDLDSTTQNYINGLGGSDVVLPSYIKSTYIDSTQILSPTISAGTLNGTTINIEKSAYIYDADMEKKVRFIYNNLDNTSDSYLRIGRCSLNGYTQKYNCIDFVDISQDRHIYLRCDQVHVLKTGITATTDRYGDLFVKNIGTIGSDSVIGDSADPFKLVHTKNVKVYSETTTSNAYCGFSSSNYLQKYSGSSERHKHNIHSLNDDLKSRFNSLYDLEVKNWTYNDDYIDPNDQLYQKETFGLIAEDVEKVLPEFVVYDNGQVDNYRDRNLINAMLVLIQEQKRKIDELEQRLTILEGANK